MKSDAYHQSGSPPVISECISGRASRKRGRRSPGRHLLRCTAAYAACHRSQRGRTDPGPTASSAKETTHHETLEHIRKNLGDCKRCKLGTTRKNLVFGVGNPKARLVFVGEGPGADEDEKGEPFVGDAGRMLNRIITAMGIKREDVYICNVVKCRPPGTAIRRRTRLPPARHFCCGSSVQSARKSSWRSANSPPRPCWRQRSRFQNCAADSVISTASRLCRPITHPTFSAPAGTRLRSGMCGRI